eukprot:scaffold201533_cov32-Tisochrysis_lutea.AAC.2
MCLKCDARTRKGPGGGVVQGDKCAKQARQSRRNAAGHEKGAGRPASSYNLRCSIVNCQLRTQTVDCGCDKVVVSSEAEVRGEWWGDARPPPLGL